VPPFALDQRESAQVGTVMFQQVERDKHRLTALAVR
jgi:hypothetical protein